MKVTISQIRRLVLYLLFAVSFFVGGFLAGQRIDVATIGGRPHITISRQLPGGKQNLDFSLFWDVWDRLSQGYYQKEALEPAKLIYGAIKGMVAAAGDPYTAFLSPEEQKRTTEDLQGSFDGVGIQIGFKGNQLAVIAPLEKGPAKRAGVQAGDFILWIKDGKRGIDRGTVGISLPEAVDGIRGPAGSKVVLTLSRADTEKPFDVELVRELIDVPSVKLTLAGDVAIIKLTSFGGETNGEWEKTVGEAVDKKAKRIVLDLRNNSGGYLDGAVFIASEFLKGGTVVMEERASGVQTKLGVDRRGRLLDLPMVVLVNKGSASAAEIVAGALHDYHRARLVGEVTFGKGTIQDVQQLPTGAGLHITIAKWLTPNGTWVHNKGLEPDVKVEDKSETDQDEQLEKALEMVK